jgi:hypothetical protein
MEKQADSAFIGQAAPAMSPFCYGKPILRWRKEKKDLRVSTREPTGVHKSAGFSGENHWHGICGRDSLRIVTAADPRHRLPGWWRLTGDGRPLDDEVAVLSWQAGS